MTESSEEKVFNDSVHGTISLHPLLVKIIDTPEFQRLRNIKQLGAAYRVYPAASHNRFEHSIGVCYLAGVFIEKLKTAIQNDNKDGQQVVEISAEDVLCVKIAGLCHDIGHGPFSHLFDKEFCSLVGGTWTHEKISQDIIRHLYDGDLKKEFRNYGLGDEDVEFICDLIHPENPKKREKKAFLYEIVSNKNGIDVDRWDYFTRDCLQLGLGYSFDYKRCMELARVIDNHICYRDKEAVNIFNMFATRYHLYRCAYYHLVNSSIQLMIADAFEKAKDVLKIEGSNGLIALSNIHQDVVAYTKATDHIYYEILNSSSKEKDMQDAQKLLMRVEKRDFYEHVADSMTLKSLFITKDKREFLEKNVKVWIKCQGYLSEENLKLQVLDIGFGASGEYPLKDVYFYRKENPTVAFLLQKDDLPRPIASMTTQDIRVRVFSTLSRSDYEKIDKEKKENFNKSLTKLLDEKKVYDKELTEEEIQEILKIE